MSRVDELQKKYPRIPRDVIVKHDVMVEGVRANDDLDRASVWERAAHIYQSNDFDGNLQDLAGKAPWRVKPGYVLRAGNMRFKSGLGAQTRLRSTSNYTIREVGEGKLALYEGEERVEDVFFLRPKARTTPEPVTSRGNPISTLIDFRPSCFLITASRYCQYFSTGDQCRFCNFNTGHDAARSVGLEVPLAINLEETVEAYKIRCSDVRQVEGNFVMGGFEKAEQEVKVHLNFIENLAAATPYKPAFSIHMQATSRKDMQRLKDAGIDTLVTQIEVMDPELFPEVCPGKAKHAPYEAWIQAIHDSVDVFGVGNAGAKFVPGVTVLAPNGHKTWQEARDYHIEADNYLVRHGVLPNYLVLWWSRGSIYTQDSSNLEKFPPAEFYMEMALAQHEAMLEYGFYKTMNKFMHCGMDCTASVYAGDIGMLELAGDVGNWMADVVPPESNWIAKFIASVKSGAGVE